MFVETVGVAAGRSGEDQVIRVERGVSVCRSARTGVWTAATSVHRGAEAARATTVDGAAALRLQRADDAGSAVSVLLVAATAVDGAVPPLFQVIAGGGTAG